MLAYVEGAIESFVTSRAARDRRFNRRSSFD